jgi:gamma-glutamylcyclotransferase (GGCT)/AIG2-like uncharacterized protein YtfP/Leucine-rich repeat (LRR) protein
MRNLRKILKISQKEFANLHNLKKLDLNLREEKELPLEICQLTNLEELEIWGELTELPKEFTNLQNLKKLYFDSKEFPLEICELANLEKLEISGKFTGLPKEFANLQNLKKLDIEFELKEIPLEICELSNLEELDIWGKFTKLPKEFSNLQNLKRLRICSKIEDTSVLAELPNLENLEIFPEREEVISISIKDLQNLKSLEIANFEEVEISNLPNLRILDFNLKKFKFSNLPNLEEVTKLPPKEFNKQLKKIYLDDFEGEFNLSDFPNLEELSFYGGAFSIVGNTKLKSLSIQHTHSITELPKLENLEELYLHDIMSNSKPSKIFKNFPISKKLKKVNLCNNGLSEYFPQWIRELSELECLSLYEYGLTEIPDWMDELQNLKEISIEWSNLERVSEAVTNLKNLEKLILDMNHIKSYPQNLEKLKNLKEFKIETQKISFDEYNRIKRALPNTEIPEKNIEIFVVNSLKKDFPNHHLLENMEYLGKATTEEKYPMIVENGVPYLIAKSGIGENIRGEVYEIDFETLQKLDSFYSDKFIRKDFKVKLDGEFYLYWRYVTAYIPNFEIYFSQKNFLSEFTIGTHLTLTNIFVYGTMKKGFPNHHLLKEAKFIGEATFQYEFHVANSQNLGMVIRNSKPYLFKKEDGSEPEIKGEVYEISIQDLDKLEFEDYTKVEISVEIGENYSYAIAFVANFEIEFSKEELLSEFIGEV